MAFYKLVLALRRKGETRTVRFLGLPWHPGQQWWQLGFLYSDSEAIALL